MRRMPTKELTSAFCDYLLLDCKFDIGGEAVICRDDETNTLYKIFVLPGSDIPDYMPDNKFHKIEKLYQKSLQYSVQPLSTITLDGRLIGYEMTYDPYDISMYNIKRLSRKQKLFYLRQVKDALEYFASQDITYGDVKNDNILINPKTKKVTFCDMDNIRLGQYPIDVMGYELSDYIELRGQIDATADAYMHNLLTLQQLNFSNSSQKEILTVMRHGVRPIHMPERAMQIVESLTKPEMFNGEYIIQYIKK